MVIGGLQATLVNCLLALMNWALKYFLKEAKAFGTEKYNAITQAIAFKN